MGWKTREVVTVKTEEYFKMEISDLETAFHNWMGNNHYRQRPRIILLNPEDFDSVKVEFCSTIQNVETDKNGCLFLQGTRVVESPQTEKTRIEIY